MTLGKNSHTSEPAAPVALEILVVETIAVFSFFGNSLVLVAILRFRRLRTSSNVFVGNLSVADGLFGILMFFLPMNIVHNRLVYFSIG